MFAPCGSRSPASGRERSSASKVSGACSELVGAVDLFDPDRGTLGRLDARRNQLDQLAPVTVTRGSTLSPQPIADTGDAIWLVSGPTQLTRVSVADPGERQTVALPDPGADAVTLTWSDSDDVWTASSSHGTVAVARIEARTGRVLGRATLAVSQVPVAFVGVPGHAILVFRRSTVAIRTRDLSVGSPRRFQDTRVDAVGAATASGRLWVLDRSRASATRIDWPTGATRARVRVQGASGVLRAPYGIAGARSSIWAVAPADRTRFGAMTASGIDAGSGRVRDRFTAPATLEVGAVAVSSPLRR